MTDRLNGPERIECRLVMIDAHSMRILTTAAPPRPLLPRESIMAYTRVAEALNDAIEQRYGLCTIQLAFLPRAEGQSYCAVHEIIASRESLPGSLSLTALGEIAPSEFSGEDRAIVLAIMKGEASGLGSFARLGWIHDLLAKVGSYRDRGSMPAIRQVNQGIDFCLLSLSDAAVRKVWFKAVGEPNTREYALTVELARRFPAYLPKILATIPDWNGWVMEDVKGVPLNESDSIYQCEQALTALAVMQKEMATDVASLSALGAKDWTCARIACLSEPFFAESQRAMQAQISTKSRPLRSSELHQLKKNIESALHEFMNAGVPYRIRSKPTSAQHLITMSKHCKLDYKKQVISSTVPGFHGTRMSPVKISTTTKKRRMPPSRRTTFLESFSFVRTGLRAPAKPIRKESSFSF
jgi:hypothetical protein